MPQIGEENPRKSNLLAIGSFLFSATAGALMVIAYELTLFAHSKSSTKTAIGKTPYELVHSLF